jgi:endonuclease/exonuclease/phosphatase family metal-dependent hydrolase
MQIRLATYNIHRFIGRDSDKDHARIGRVLGEIKPDIFALQEVEYFRNPDELDFLRQNGGAHMVLGPTIIAGDEHYGNVLLSRFPVTAQRKIDLSFPGREERSAIDVDINCQGKIIRVIATHFGLSPYERREQAKNLLEAINKKKNSREDITLLMGDINEWFLWGRPLRFIHNYFGSCPDLATYPAKLPIFSLDRIWCHPPELITDRKVHKTSLARTASDHLPLKAVLNIQHRK